MYSYYSTRPSAASSPAGAVTVRGKRPLARAAIGSVSNGNVVGPAGFTKDPLRYFYSTLWLWAVDVPLSFRSVPEKTLFFVYRYQPSLFFFSPNDA